MTSDEALFHLSGTVNKKKNFRHYYEHNLTELQQKHLRSKRVTVWREVGIWGILNPYFFEELILFEIIS